ncbi:MAG TPA: recombinase family protein [Chryseolinea sp.]|nr:recombinase family protein [Chryseolinea sp.]
MYTRVSTKEQADTNQSLETQKKYCLEYALKSGLNVLAFFGGTYESAKTDERNEFNRMIRFSRNQKEAVSHILVYSLDRFSRTGDNAIFISSELKKQGISIVSVTQPYMYRLIPGFSNRTYNLYSASMTTICVRINAWQE